MPTYDMCGRMAIKAMEQIDGVRDKLRTNQLLEPEVLSLKTFDQLDCTKILQTALSITHGVIEDRIKLADAQHKGTRKAKEAGAEITSMKAELKEKRGSMDAKRKRAELIEEVAQEYELDPAQVQKIKANVGQLQGFDQKKHKKQVQLIEARALTLANGQTLSEPLLKANLEKLQGNKRTRDDRGKGGYRGSKGGRGRPEHKSGARKCFIKGCDEDAPINPANGKAFALCKGCNAKAKEGKKLIKKDGTEWRQKVAARVAHMAEDSDGDDGMKLIKVGKEHHQVHAQTLEVLRHAGESGLEVTEGNAKTDWRDNLRAVLQR